MMNIILFLLMATINCFQRLPLHSISGYLRNNKMMSSTTAYNIEDMNIFQRLSRAVSFYSVAIPVFASYKLLEEKLSFLKLTRDISKEEEEKEYQKLHEWGSEVITEKIKELRGFYVKTGQIISTRVDIFPIEYTSKLAGNISLVKLMSIKFIKVKMNLYWL